MTITGTIVPVFYYLSLYKKYTVCYNYTITSSNNSNTMAKGKDARKEVKKPKKAKK